MSNTTVKPLETLRTLTMFAACFALFAAGPPLFPDDGLDSRVAEHWVSRKLNHPRRKIDCH